MEINRFYHRERAEAEERVHRARFEEGESVMIGREYSAVTARGGEVLRGPFTALAYRDGLLMLGGDNGRLFLFIDADVAANGNEIFTERLPMPVRFKEDPVLIAEGPGDEKAKREALRAASAVKWLRPLSEAGAELLLHWLRR